MKHRCGEKQCFHGAYSKKSRATDKARQVKGRVKFVHLGRHGGPRWVVLTKKK